MEVENAVPPSSETLETAEERARREALLRQSELIISNVLRGGVMLSALVILAGVIAFYVRYQSSGGHLATQPIPNTLGAVVAGLSHGEPVSIIALGLLILLATPFFRVAVSIITFALERDWVFTAITLLVLLILIVSFLLGRGGA